MICPLFAELLMDIDSGDKTTTVPAKPLVSTDIKHSAGTSETASSGRPSAPSGSVVGTGSSSFTSVGRTSSAVSASVLPGVLPGNVLKRTASQALQRGPSVVPSAASQVGGSRFFPGLVPAKPIQGTTIARPVGSLPVGNPLLALSRPTQSTPSTPVVSGVSGLSQQKESDAESTKPSPTQEQVPKLSTSITENPSSQASVPSTQQARPLNKEEQKAQQWLRTMRARAVPGPMGGFVHVPRHPGPARAAMAAAASSGDQDVDMDPVRPRSIRAGVRFAESASDGEGSDTESVGSALGSTGELLQALQAIADISAFNAECLSKLSGLPMPDFDSDEGDTAAPAVADQ